MCAVGEFSDIDELDLCGREVNVWSAGLFQYQRWISIFHFVISAHFTFHLYHLYVFNALSVKNVERLITVWWSKA